MNRARLVGISSVAIAVMAAGACGSAVKSASSRTAATVTKLDLASGARTSTPSAPSAGAAIFPARPMKYVLDARLANLGTNAVVWRMDPHSVTAADVQHFADVFGLTGSPTHTSTGWQVQGKSAVLSFIVSGGDVSVSYALGVPSAVGGSAGSAGTATPSNTVTNGPLKVVPPVPSPIPIPTPTPTPTPIPTPAPVRTPPTVIAPPVPPVDMPSAVDATSIARGLLNRLGVLAGQTWSTAVTNSGGVAVSCAVGMPCPTVSPEVSARSVTFSRMLGGTRVDGVDWSVTIGGHRRVESVNGEWATPAAISSYPLRSTAAVFADLQHGTAKYPGPQPMLAVSGAPAVGAPTIATSPSTATIPTVAVHVTGVSLGIARWDAYTNGQTVVDLVPTYRFHARVDGDSNYDIEVLALDLGGVTFTDPSPTPQPLPAQPAPSPPQAAGSVATPPST
jgi:hypothetical protein